MERVDIDARQLVCKTLPQLVCALHRPSLVGEAAPEVTFTLDYDILVFAVGAVPNTFNTPGVQEARSWPLTRPLSSFEAQLTTTSLERAVLQGDWRRATRAARGDCAAMTQACAAEEALPSTAF